MILQKFILIVKKHIIKFMIILKIQIKNILISLATTKKGSIFEVNDIENQIQKSLKTKVWLKKWWPSSN